MKQLTKAEEEVMQGLWDLGEANVAQLIEQYEEPKPAYNTISTIVRILENKGFVDYRKEGRGHIYFPLVTKSDYSKQSISTLLEGYFKGSFRNMVSFFVKENDISVKELEALLEEIQKDKKS